MGANERLYLSLMDHVFHRRNLAAIAEHVTAGYRAHDPFIDDDAVGGRRGLSEIALRSLREVRYEVADLFEQDDRLAARFVMLARRPNGARVAVPGVSINRVRDGRLHEGWVLADYGDVADLAQFTPLPADAWQGEPLAIAPQHPAAATSRLAAYRWLVDQIYERRVPEDAVQALHPSYVGFDPFRERGVGSDGLIAFHKKIISLYTEIRYHVVDAVEAGDRLAVRYRVEARDTSGRRVVVPGLSINHFEGPRIRRGWTFNHYGMLG